MKTIRIGLTFVSVCLLIMEGMLAQTCTPDLTYQASNSLSAASVPLLGTANLSGTNIANLSVTYSDPTNTYPLGYTAADYEPLEVFWEFKYTGGSTGGLRHYAFQKNPNITFEQTSNPVEVTMWTIDKYDDDEPPPRAYNFNVNTNGAAAPARQINNTQLTIRPSWDPTPDDEVMFIIGLEYNCDDRINGDLTFTFDATLADVISSETYPAATSYGPGVVVWDVNNNLIPGALPNMRYKDFYVRLKMKRSARPGNSFNCSASFVNDPATIAGILCKPPDDVSRADTIDISHDPNRKYIRESELLCMDVAGNEVTVQYKVTYQNIGASGAKKVTVLDYLDEKAYINSAKFIDAKHAVKRMNFDASDNLINPTDGYMEWYFEYLGQGLRGTDEPTYSVDFWEDKTEGWIIFEVTYDKAVLKKCNGLMNHARITFDCNPEFYTNTTIAEVCCNEPDFPDTCMVVGGELLPSNALEVTGGTIPGFSLPQGVKDDINTQFSGQTPGINWYPDEWIANNNSLDAVMSPLEDITYTLIVSAEQGSGSCERMIYKLFIDVDDHGREDEAPMYIMDDDNENDCTSTPIIIGGSPLYTYEWEDGSTNSSLTISGGTKTCRLTVTDAHGCKKKFETTITCSKRKMVDVAYCNSCSRRCMDVMGASPK